MRIVNFFLSLDTRHVGQNGRSKHVLRSYQSENVQHGRGSRLYQEEARDAIVLQQH